MKLKILTIFVLSFFVLSSVPVVFAENVEVVGRVENSTTNTSGSKVVFKDSSSQQVIITTTVDPAGIYIVSVPQGKYDITVVPPAGSPLKPVTKSNQQTMSNAVSDFTLPSSTNSFDSLMQSTPMKMLYTAAGIVLVLLVVIVYFLVKRNKLS